MKKTIILALFITMIAPAAYGDIRYVTDHFQITVRSGPGTDYRVVRMLSSGQRVEMLERQDDWTRIQIPGGPQGWVLHRFLQPDPAARQTVETLMTRMEQLQTENESLGEENQRLIEMNQELSGQIEEKNRELEKIRSDYEQLATDSAEYLEIREKHEEVTARLEEKTARIEELESRITDAFLSSAIQWFLAGAGVLLLGMLIGGRQKKKRPGLR